MIIKIGGMRQVRNNEIQESLVPNNEMCTCFLFLIIISGQIDFFFTLLSLLTSFAQWGLDTNQVRNLVANTNEVVCK